MPAGHAHELSMNRLARPGTTDRRLGRQLLNRLANCEGAGTRGQCLAEIDINVIWDALRPFPKKTALLITEDAAPDMVKANRNDRSGRALHNLLQTALKGEQKPRSRDAPLGEDTH